MATKGHKPGEIVSKLRQITEQTYYRLGRPGILLKQFDCAAVRIHYPRNILWPRSVAS